ncbi:MAG: molybdenum cofactor biosynthesis protein MoaE [Candidatus Rokubacteria bacterium]|nr:molybdenum cofactor biosynthesis protein MoaE [Candidatus Rokubacteria bacterium]MBI2554167.1 molybdenum cofactor biosynthesis protein MoaE [Candidatus Rokubacteria bacterium]
MKVQVRLFARYREAAGRDHVELELPEGGTVEAAWAAVAERYPALRPYRPYTLFAVGQDYVPPEHPLRPGDEVCLFPPVSGGSDGADLYRVTSDPLSEAAVTAAVADPEAGGVVVFSGVVRDETGGRRVKFLEYEAHAPMAEAKMRGIGGMVRARWPGVKRVAMVHRVGRLEIGEASVIIAVSAGHRAEAFEACRFAIDRLKETVPIWKKEYFEDGEVWVGLQSECDHRH